MIKPTTSSEKARMRSSSNIKDAMPTMLRPTITNLMILSMGCLEGWSSILEVI